MQRGQRVLHAGAVDALLLEAGDDLRPAGAVGEQSVYEDDIAGSDRTLGLSLARRPKGDVAAPAISMVDRVRRSIMLISSILNLGGVLNWLSPSMVRGAPLTEAYQSRLGGSARSEKARPLTMALASCGPCPPSPVRWRAPPVVLASVVRRLGFRLSAEHRGCCGACSKCRSKAPSAL
jgi:hypothetical protein